jgi:HAD superfamily hydrolase (TIGR01549 family)
MKLKLIIFDLDGVLINSLPNMIYSWNKVKKKFKIKNEFKEYYKFIGLDFYEILENLRIKKKDFLKIKKAYSKFSNEGFNKVKLYKNVKKTLIQLNRIAPLAILTSKDKDRTKKILKKLLFEINFQSVQSPTKKFRSKPSSDLMLKLVAENNLNLDQVIFVGDSIYDYQMAKKAHVKFIYARYGYSNLKIKKMNTINSINQIFKFVK